MIEEVGNATRSKKQHGPMVIFSGWGIRTEAQNNIVRQSRNSMQWMLYSVLSVRLSNTSVEMVCELIKCFLSLMVTILVSFWRSFSCITVTFHNYSCAIEYKNNFLYDFAALDQEKLVHRLSGLSYSTVKWN